MSQPVQVGEIRTRVFQPLQVLSLIHRGPVEERAYCFCPVVRNRLEQGMSTTFCYCGSGWFRQQWEGALGKPVRIEIVKSIVKGDDVCQFAIHLPADL